MVSPPREAFRSVQGPVWASRLCLSRAQNDFSRSSAFLKQLSDELHRNQTAAMANPVSALETGFLRGFKNPVSKGETGLEVLATS
jgi:hypothetical protein